MARIKRKSDATAQDLLKEESTTGEFIDFPQVHGNSPFKPDKQFYVRALAEGKAVGIHQLREYPTFFKLFRRYTDNHKLPLKLSLRQVKPDLWLLVSRRKTERKPGSLIVGDWREHGRYKWYAHELERGETVVLDDEKEATKARRAWMLYNRAEARADREAVIELKGAKYRVRVRPIEE